MFFIEKNKQIPLFATLGQIQNQPQSQDKLST